MSARKQAATLPPMTEKAFMAAVVKLAKMLGWEHYHTWTSIHSPRGFPDLVLARPKERDYTDLIFAELKSESGTLTAAQERWIELLRTADCRVYVWRPSDLERIAEILR
jgi:hypothetical protein